MCYKPQQLKTINPHTNEPYHVPCGNCPECIARKISAWSFRIMSHARAQYTAHGVTLTYDNANVPRSRNNFKTLNKKHVQDFFKRLRKSTDKFIQSQAAKATFKNDLLLRLPISYFACGEYGTDTKRPHYHAIIFNTTPELITQAWRVPTLDDAGRNTYSNGSLITHPLGNVHFTQNTSPAWTGYCLKYMHKSSWKPLHRNDDRAPEFRLMSKGIGANYVTEEIIRWHRDDLLNRMHCVLPDGRKMTMPRYYKTRIYPDATERELISSHLVQTQLENTSKLQQALIQKYGADWERVLFESQFAKYNNIQNSLKNRQDL